MLTTLPLVQVEQEQVGTPSAASQSGVLGVKANSAKLYAAPATTATAYNQDLALLQAAVKIALLAGDQEPWRKSIS
jgi:hypothetical protein